MSVLIKGLQLPKFSSYYQITEIIGFSGAVNLYPNGEAKIRITTSPYHTQSYSIVDIPADKDVRPVVRGEWLSARDGAKVEMLNGEPQYSCFCSVCGDWLTASDEYGVKGNFCPNCGADMRDDEND